MDGQLDHQSLQSDASVRKRIFYFEWKPGTGYDGPTSSMASSQGTSIDSRKAITTNGPLPSVRDGGRVRQIKKVVRKEAAVEVHGAFGTAHTQTVLLHSRYSSSGRHPTSYYMAGQDRSLRHLSGQPHAPAIPSAIGPQCQGPHKGETSKTRQLPDRSTRWPFRYAPGGSFSWPGDPCRSCPTPPPGRVVSCPASDFSFRDQQRLSITVLKVSKTCPLILPSQFLPTHQSVTLFDHRFVPRLQYFLQPQPDLSAPSILGTGHGRRETNRKRSAAGLPSCNPQSFSQGQGHLHRAGLAWHGLALRMPLPTKRAARCIVCSPPWMEISLAPFRAVDIQNLYGSNNLGCCNIGQRAHFVLGHTRKTVSSSSKRWLMMRDLLLV